MKNSKEINHEDEKEIDEYLKLDVDLLFDMIARKFFSNKQDMVKEGKKILKQIDEKLFQTICVEMEFCKNKSRFSYLDTRSLAILVLKNLESIPYKNSHIPKIILAVILVKIGLNRFCKC